MTNITTFYPFEFDEYKALVRAWVERLPSGGRGEYRKLALQLRVSSTMISQIFNGSKHLSLENAADLSDYLGFEGDEEEYFLLLVQKDKAGSYNLTTKLKKKLSILKDRNLSLKKRLISDTELSEATKAQFYSSWVYSGVRMLSAINNMSNVQSIADQLSLPRNEVQKVVDFLIQNGLCKIENDKIEVGPQRTHLPDQSPHIPRHHQNWRVKGFDKMLHFRNDNLFYTAPMSLSLKTCEKIRQELPAMIQSINKWVHPSASETVRCLNIDWFEY